MWLREFITNKKPNLKEITDEILMFRIEKDSEGYINELKIDAVGLWLIYRTQLGEYILKGDSKRKYIHDIIVNILDAGAEVVFGSLELKCWIPTNEFGSSSVEIAENLCKKYIDNEREPTFSDPWFATKEFYKSEKYI